MSLPLAALGAVIAALFEVSVLPETTIAGVKPDLVYVFAVVAAMILGVEDGLVWAFLGGMMLDVLTTQRPLGASMLSLLVVVGIAVAAARVLGSARLPMAVAAAFVLTWLYQLLLLTILGATSGLASSELPIRAIAVISLLNGLLALLLAIVARWLVSRLSPVDRLDW